MTSLPDHFCFSEATMRIWRLVASAIAITLLAALGVSDAGAFGSSVAGPVERTRATTRQGNMPPYGASLHREVLAEIRRNTLPFRIVQPARLAVVFAVNRRGELVQFGFVKKSGSKLIDDYAELMVRQASRRFRPPPADLPGDVLRFSIPVSFR